MIKKNVLLVILMLFGITLFAQGSGNNVSAVIDHLGTDGKIKLADILSLKEIKTNTSGYKVVSFTVGYTEDNGNYTTKSSSSNLISDEQVAFVTKLNYMKFTTKTVNFENIKATGPDSKSIALPAVKATVVK
jgi:hypothetical protein